MPRAGRGGTVPPGAGAPVSGQDWTTTGTVVVVGVSLTLAVVLALAWVRKTAATAATTSTPAVPSMYHHRREPALPSPPLCVRSSLRERTGGPAAPPVPLPEGFADSGSDGD